MIRKMKFINIMGPVSEFDRVVQNYFQKYDIQLENALSELKTVHDIKPFIESNPYESKLRKCEELASQIEGQLLFSEEINNKEEISVKEAIKTVEKIDTALKEMQEQIDMFVAEKNSNEESLKKIQPFRSLNFEVSAILDFKFIKFRFGKFPKEYYDRFCKTVYDNTMSIFLNCYDDLEYVWGVYFVPIEVADKVDAILTSLHFERIFIPDEYEGTTEEACLCLEKQIEDFSQEIKKVIIHQKKLLTENIQKIYFAKEWLTQQTNSFDVRKLAACTDKEENTYFILCGWITEEDESKLEMDLLEDNNITCFAEDEHRNIFSKPPTELKNPKIFKPFEMYVRMYGLPAYNELDPTIFVALTYSFIFGIMFGDVGQGLCLIIGGFLFYKLKKADLAAIIGTCGVFSTIFGALFGSVFGFEELIEPLWIRPISYMSEVPFVGKLNYIFIVTVGFGMFIILLTMVFNIINSYKSHNLEKGIFDTNGIAGFVFFGATVVSLILLINGYAMPGGILLFIMFGLPLLAIALKEPIMNLIEKKAKILPEEKGMYITQTFFELFEVLLGYFSNTLSFVRIGAFAVSHAAMMEVVLMLAGAEQGRANIIIIIIGNIFVCGMEGLIVGIQVLRLEFYEMFSRFYMGTGHAFKPFRASLKTNNK